MSQVASHLRTQRRVCRDLHTLVQRVHGIGIKRRRHKQGKEAERPQVGETDSVEHQSRAGRRKETRQETMVGHSEILRRQVKVTLGLISVKQKAHQQSIVGMSLTWLQAGTTTRKTVTMLRCPWAPWFFSCFLRLQCCSSTVFLASSYLPFCPQPPCLFLTRALLSSCPFPTETREPVREENHSRV